jgi:hypothetical protein
VVLQSVFDRVSPDAAAPARGYTDWRGGAPGVAACRFNKTKTKTNVRRQHAAIRIHQTWSPA